MRFFGRVQNDILGDWVRFGYFIVNYTISYLRIKCDIDVGQCHSVFANRDRVSLAKMYVEPRRPTKQQILNSSKK